MRFRYSAEETGKPVKKAAVYVQNEHKINFSDVDSQAVYIVERLQANGYETYIVGGAVRDLILKKKPKDFDIVTAANPAKIKKIFRNARIIGRRFRLVHVFFGPKIFELSTFRSIKDGPTGNTFGTIDEDVQRRDFSLNALFYDPIKQLVIDYVGGMKDIKRRVIRPVIALPDIFTDDPVRMIRAVKYAAATAFTLPFTLKLRIRKDAELLADVSPSRLTEEIFKIIHSPHAREIVELLDRMKLYGYLQPEAVELFRSAPGFKTKYLATLGTRNLEDAKKNPGEALQALIRDYLEETVDWSADRLAEEGVGSRAQSEAELYKEVFTLARKFVLPMNPPRVELEGAIRLLFAEHGITVRKPRFIFSERRGRPPRQAGPHAAKTPPEKKKPAREGESAGAIPEGAPIPPASPAAKRRRRGRRTESGRTDTPGRGNPDGPTP